MIWFALKFFSIRRKDKCKQTQIVIKEIAILAKWQHTDCEKKMKKKRLPSLSLHGFGLSEPTEDRLPLAFPEFSWLVTRKKVKKWIPWNVFIKFNLKKISKL